MRSASKYLVAVLVVALLLGVVSTASHVQARNQAQAEFVAPIMVVNSSFLNVRTGPGIQYSILVTVVGGTELPVLGVARDRVWYQVSTLAGVGWINSQYALPRGDFSNVPFVEAPTVTVPGVVTPTAPEAADEGVGVGFGSGRQWGISVVEAHPFRRDATINSNSPGNIQPDPSFIYTVLEARSGDGIIWYRINDTVFGNGWVEGPKTYFRPFACELTAVVFLVDAAPQIGPDGTGTLDGNVRVMGGQEAYLIGAQGSFYKVELVDGNSGWVPSDVVEVREGVRSTFCESGGSDGGMGGGDTPGQVPGSGAPPAQFAGPRVVINTGFLNLRSGPGVQYTIVTSLPGGTELPVIGVAPDRVWYLVEGTFGRAWLNSEFTLFRGDGRNLPVIRDIGSAQISTPTARVTNAVSIYSAPSTNAAVVGALSGPIDLQVVARTADFVWVQVRTDLGFGWVLAALVELRGDTALIPVVSS